MNRSKVNLICLLLFLCVLPIRAADYFTRPTQWSIEAGTGLLIPPADMDGFYESRAGKVYYGELGYQFSKIPLNVGFYTGHTVFSRLGLDNNAYQFKSLTLMPVIDYNKRITRHVSFFLGIGGGVMMHRGKDLDETTLNVYDIKDYNRTAFTLMARFGVTFFNLIRISAGYNAQRPTERYGFMAVGLTLRL